METADFINSCRTVQVVDECKCLLFNYPSSFGNYFDQLPSDILMMVFIETASTPKQIVRLSQLSKAFYRMIRSPQIWKQLAAKFEVKMNPPLNECQLCLFRRNYCAQFYEWNANRCHSWIRIDNKRITSIQGAWNTAVFGRPLTKGCHEFIFTIINCASIMFGVQSVARVCTGQGIWPGTGRVGITSNNDSVACYSSIISDQTETFLQANDVIKMIVDLDERYALFFQNNWLIKYRMHRTTAHWETRDPMEIIVMCCGTPNCVQFESYRRL